jgi:ADP-ribose pyrophosphatase YjhB (NUDIX family)
MKKLIEKIESHVKNPSKGLPEDIFYLAGRLTPFINVDLLVQDDLGRTLLSWRDESLFENNLSSAWHIPGGIIRLRETISERLHKVAMNEMRGKLISFSKEPLKVGQFIDHHRKNRSHHIGLLYKCKLEDNYEIDNKNLNFGDSGFLEWHSSPPDDFHSHQLVYKGYFL